MYTYKKSNGSILAKECKYYNNNISFQNQLNQQIERLNSEVEKKVCYRIAGYFRREFIFGYFV